MVKPKKTRDVQKLKDSVINVYHFKKTTYKRVYKKNKIKEKMTALTKVKINEKQEKFLDNLISNGGNITKACVDAGYSPNTTNWLMRKLKDEIIERTKLHLASAGVKAASRIIEALDADGSIPANQSDVRIRAANDILDRVGVSKRQEIHTQTEILHSGCVFTPKQDHKDIPYETIEG